MGLSIAIKKMLLKAIMVSSGLESQLLLGSVFKLLLPVAGVGNAMATGNYTSAF